MKTWYLLEEIFGTDQDPKFPDDKAKRIPHIVRTYISDTEYLPKLRGADYLESFEYTVQTLSRRVAGVEPVEAETWQEAKEKFKEAGLI